ncbi:MAG TPA: hypothetical protein VFP58_02545 [Candidatus Eisenbacteria bacterium]|nr:hypothetical protein [Candidatus Eisenbacteria bacterium]
MPGSLRLPSTFVAALALAATVSCGLLVPDLAWCADEAETEPPPDRPVIVGVTIGIRMFHEELQLGDDFSFGGRVGVGLGDRWALMMDFVACHPSRPATAVAAYVDALRMLARFNLHTGKFRPYMVGGIGGVLFMFQDSPTSAGGALTLGVGADYRVAPQTRLYLEATTDLYSQQQFTYLPGGAVSYHGDYETKTLGNVGAGISVEF